MSAERVEIKREYTSEGRVYVLAVDGTPLLHAFPGGTGPCWNIRDAEDAETGGDWLHVCELDAAIDALTALRDSNVHAANVERWA